MGTARAVTIGSGIGAVAAAAFYVAVGSPGGPAATHSALPVMARPVPGVPLFTTETPAPCDAPTVLEGDLCVLHVAGPATTLPNPAGPDHGPEAGTAPLPLGAQALRSGPAASPEVETEDRADQHDDGLDDEHDEPDEPERTG